MRIEKAENSPQQPFPVHGIAELGLTGAAGGLLSALDVTATTGALLGSVMVGLLLGPHDKEPE